ncbi:ADP-ribosylglycohydrolase family protein [Streptomyces sp. P9-2B-2]|uniref:ADP-ribosylglycohydrolase family protein n=1 Tax=Streptomyces sp. P9-2B-2 TaxID=3057114 RepID=UPI0025B31D97|nr:ADP-ribosylglycohydrolase family protein [Streptomyces sp. P9-2B-2]WJY37685.1 ADP-ribosylglycohydrolase family protein [Streptomyces sp. P9-2B-2]
MTATAAAPARPAPAAPLRVTWVQPEDLIGHELRQAAEDGRDAAEFARRWRAAGGTTAPGRAGASPGPAGPALRALAGALLDELALLPCPSAADEPTELTAIRRQWAPWLGDGGPGPDGGVPTARLEAAWLGRAAGCLLGKPVEKLPLDGIRALARSTGNWPLTGYFTEAGLDPAVAARHPWNRRSRATSLAGNIDGMPEDDDLDYPLLGLLLLERHGPGFTTADVARLWLDELPAGRTFTAERLAYRNLLDGIEPPHTARYRNPFREWIGAQIRADVHGWTHPGDPAAAAAQAWRDATLSHTANGVYAAMFVAAALAAAAGGGTDVHGALRAGLAVLPVRSRLARAVRRGVALARGEPTGTPAGFATVVDRLHRAYGHHHWVHTVPNAALLAAALTHADGDFSGSLCRVVSGGWDTDSNGATAGSLTGLLAGSPGALPARWTAPLRNRLATSVRGLDGIGFDALAARTAALVVPGTPAHRTKAPAP